MEVRAIIPSDTCDGKLNASSPHLCLAATDMSTKPTTKKRKPGSFKCRFKGCGISGDTVKNGGCPLHYEGTTKKQAFNKRAERAVKLGLPCSHHPFKMKRDGDLLKVAFYYKNVGAPADASRLMIIMLGCQGLYNNL